MPKYRIRITRDVTESQDRIIEANSPEEAQAEALCNVDDSAWEPDDCTGSDPYLPDPGEYEIV